MALPLRYQLVLVFVGLNVVSTAFLASFAYRTSRQSLEEQSSTAVGVVAEQREKAVTGLLQRRLERMQAFLASVESLCGERAPTGSLGWEPECVRVALGGFRRAERPTAAELRYGTERLASNGEWRGAGITVGTGELAEVSAESSELTTVAGRGRLTLRARFPLKDIEPIFSDRSGLRTNGEVFLVDASGAVLTPLRYATAAQSGSFAPIRQCESGRGGETRAPDYRGVDVITAYRPMPALAGACVVANVQYADVLVPIRRLGRTFAYASSAFVVLGMALAFFISHAIAKPISNLAASARAMEKGQFDQAVRNRGPAEVRQLERAFASMSRSIGDLVQREHAARVDAEASSRLKDDFLATISHELRTPLNAILGWASIIVHGRADEARTAHAIRAIERSARMQARLVDELLDVSRIINGQMRLHIADVWLDAVVDAAFESVRPAAEAKGLQLVKRVEPQLRPVAGDAHRLQQVMWNLLSNAVRFTPQGGGVEVAVREIEGRAEIRVTDTGIGIRPDFIPHVFERFRQADGSVTRMHGGLGLGLSIVRHLVELHGGSVAAASAGEGRGATFTVQLPVRASVPAVTRRAELTPSGDIAAALQGTRVLVVDDDPDARDVLREMLEDAGATVATTASAGETRNVIGQVQPHLLIADIGMPGEDGYSLIRSVRALESDATGHVPAIALTAHARAEDVERALASGFQLHVAKPVNPSHLLNSIAELVHQ